MDVLAVTTGLDPGTGSLRQAILDANAATGIDNINVRYNGALGDLGVATRPTSARPEIAGPVTLESEPNGGAGIRVVGGSTNSIIGDGIRSAADAPRGASTGNMVQGNRIGLIPGTSHGFTTVVDLGDAGYGVAIRRRGRQHRRRHRGRGCRHTPIGNSIGYGGLGASRPGRGSATASHRMRTWTIRAPASRCSTAATAPRSPRPWRA